MKPTKLFLSLLLCAMALLCLPMASASAAVGDTFTEGEGVVTYKVLAEPSGGNPGRVQVGDGSSAAVDPSTKALTLPVSVTHEKKSYAVTAIGGSAFKGCASLTMENLPGSVTSIGAHAFSGCESLALKSLPEKVTSIESFAFSGCESLALKSLPENVKFINNNAFDNCTSLALTSLPDSVSYIGKAAFFGCTNLALTGLSDKVTTIGEGAFVGCSKLAFTSLPRKLTTIASQTFFGCTSLALESLPESVTSIGGQAFSGCENLALKNLPTDLTTIGNAAFLGCTNLALESLPGKVTSIGSSAFFGCENLALTSLPESVTSIGGQAFSGCKKLALTSLPRELTTIALYTFNDCTSLALTSLPEKVTTIGNSAFYNCTSLALTSLPTGVTTIGDYAFWGCTDLALTSLPKDVTTIGNQAFSSCSKLALTSLPEKLTSIGAQAFYNCKGITSLTCTKMEAPDLGTNAFLGTPITSIHVPAGATGYTKENGWPVNGTQEITVSGKVSDGDGKAIEGATVKLKGATYTTGVDGKYSVTADMQTGEEFVVTASKSGYVQGTFTGNATGGDVKEADITLVQGVAPQITTESLATGMVGADYSATLTATGTTPITWSAEGKLPDWLALNTQTGEMSGKPTQIGTYTFTVKAANGISPEAEKAFSITVHEEMTIDTKSLATGVVGEKYEATLAATGTAPITWSVSEGSLPDGLTLDAQTGEISGKPTQIGTHAFTVKATNSVGSEAEKAFSITVHEEMAIDTASLATGMVGTGYSATLEVKGTAPITWSISEGELPAGLTLGEQTGVISGTPTGIGESKFTVKATNGMGDEAEKALSITVHEHIVIDTKSLATGMVGEKYEDQTLAATGTAPIEWSVSEGSLPDGLALDEQTGVISGTPTGIGESKFTVKATNSVGSAATAPLSITVHEKMEVMTISELAAGTAGAAYGQMLEVKGTAPITWSISEGELPAGLTLDAQTGEITGTPTGSGTYTFTVKAVNGVGSEAEKELTLTVHEAIRIQTETLAGGTVGKAYSQRLTATGEAPIAWSISKGSLPDGLTLGAQTGEITGTPTAAGTSTFTVKAANEVSPAAEQALSIRIVEPEPDIPPLRFTTQPAASTIVTAGSITGTLKAAATVAPGGTATLNWFACDSSGALTGPSLAEGNTFEIPKALTPGTYTYRCQATYAGMEAVNSRVATVKVKPESAALQITRQPKDQYVVTGQQATFSLSVSGEGLSYQWYIDRNSGEFVPIEGATSASYTSSEVTLANEGFQYKCRVEDAYGDTLDSQAAKLYVSQAVVPPKTGDSATPGLWLAMCVLGGAGLVLLAVRRRRKA